MKKTTLLILPCLIAALAAPALSGTEEYLLYTPKSAAGDQVPASPDQGVLVKRVTVKRGDTLSRIAKHYLGVAGYFPQVLLFNQIKNPDLIYAGDNLLVPVSGREAYKKGVKGSRATKGAKLRKAKYKHHTGRRHHVARRIPQPAQTAPAVERVQPVPAPVASSREQQSYQRAKQAYLSGQYRKAQDLLAGFLRRFPNSPFAPDAALYQADCFLHMSGQ